MAAGCPVIATAVGGNVEAVVDEMTGLLVPSGDADALAAAVQRLLDRPDERRRFSIAARRRARESFGMDRMTRAYEGVYANVAARPARRVASPSQVRT
jgi:glycosyltransferase involved in cell wall biosynthesis